MPTQTNNSVKHTPGPWNVAPEIDGYAAGQMTRVLTDTTGHVCQIASTYNQTRAHIQFGFETAEANARLIAAAPTVLASLTELADTLAKYVVWETANGGSRLRLPLARAIRIVALSGGAELDPGRCPYCLGSLYKGYNADEHGVFSYFACLDERHTFRAINNGGDRVPDFSEVEVEG